MNDDQPPFPKNQLYGEVPPEEDDHGALEPNTLIIEDETLRGGFTSAPNYILSAADISIPARFTYIVLLSFAWKLGSCFPGQTRLASTLGVTDRAVRKYLGELIEHHYIKVTRRGLGKTNVYHILKVTQTPPEPDRNARSVQERNTGSHLERNTRSDKEYTEEKDSVEEDSDHSKFRKVGDLLKTRENQPPKRQHLLEDTLMLEVENRPGKTAQGGKIAQVFEQLSTGDLHDPTHIKSNVTRAENLWRASKLAEEEFLQLVREAKTRTLERTGAIKKEAGYLGFKNQAPYFFQVLKHLLQRRSITLFRQTFSLATKAKPG